MVTQECLSGLVKYALMHGQPVNSVLNGVLPIHVAASSGNELVVQMLIEAGADVNAARWASQHDTDAYPRTAAHCLVILSSPSDYLANIMRIVAKLPAVSVPPASPQKWGEDDLQADSKLPGSTPMHFAAANGHDKIVLLLLSHGADPSIAEKHGLTPEDLARQGGHQGVLSVLELWRQGDNSPQRRGSEDMDSALTVRRGYESPNRQLQPSSSSVRDLRVSSPNSKQGGQVASSSASIHSVSSARKLLSKPSLDTISNKGKKLAKAASNPNLAAFLHGQSSSAKSSPAYSTSNHPAHGFAPQPTALRQNPLRALSTTPTSLGTTPSQTMQRQATLPTPAAPHHIHHIINIDKARRPSLPSVFEKAAHPGQSLKTALGMTSTAGSGFSSGRSNASSGRDNNDPYRIGRPKRSGSRTSLTSVFRPGHQTRDRGSEGASQPLSPAASSFFTGDDELEQAERETFLRTGSERGASTEDGYPQQLSSNYPYSRQHPAPGGRLSDGYYGRSRAGSGSSAATTGSGRSYSQRGYSSAGPPPSAATAYPTTAPPTQSTFFADQPSSSGDLSRLRPLLSPHSSTSSIRIPAPIPAPPSSSTQPFFSKAAISAAHNNPPIARPGFYRPRKSSHLSTSASQPERSIFLHSPDPMPTHSYSSNVFEEALYDDEDDVSAHTEHSTGNSGAPALVIRRPTIQETTSSYLRSRNPRQASSSDGASRPAYSPPPSSSGNRHSRAASDDIGITRPPTGLADVQEDDSPDARQRSQSHGGAIVTHTDETEKQEDLDPETARESQDTFPTDQERPFFTRSRAGSRARVDSVGSTNSSSRAYDSGSSSAGPQTSPAPSSVSTFPHLSTHLRQVDGGASDSWQGYTRPARSGSTTTDTRTSRSGSLGESGQLPLRFLAFDYSSSPGETAIKSWSNELAKQAFVASSSSFYQPSNSTNATSVTSTPPGTAQMSTVQQSSRQLPDAHGAKVVTHAQAQNMVQRKEQELLSFQQNPAATQSNLGYGKPQHRTSLTQQLAAYGDSLAIARELSDAEKRRKDPAQPVALVIPEPPASAKYSYEILGKETRTTMPVSSGKRAKDVDIEAGNPKLWTHKMVSPFEVPLPRPAGSGPGHRANNSITSMTTITSSGKPFGRGTGDSTSPSSSSKLLQVPSGTDPVAIAASQAGSIYAGRENALRTKSSTLSTHSQHLAPPSLGSDLSIHRKSPRLPSPSSKSPRSSSERDRPVNTYHVVAGPGSEPTDSAGSSLVSEPRSVGMRHASGTTDGSSHRHRHSRSDGHQVSQSPEMPSVTEETPRPQLLRLETVMAPKFHTERKAGGEAAPSPTKNRFGKIGKLFK